MNVEEITKQLFFLFFALVVTFLIKQEHLISLALILFLLISLKLSKEKSEWRIFVLGSAIGFLMELMGIYFYKLQYWNEASLFGMPLWLPILWGIGFIYIRRIGNLVIKK